MKTITRIISINYKELVSCLAKLDEEDPQRCHGELDLLKENIRKHLMQFIKGGFLIFQLDDQVGKAYICGEPIMEDMYDFPRVGCSPERSSSEKIWFQIQYSLEEVKLYDAYEMIFGAHGINDNEKNQYRKPQLRCERCNGYYTYSDENGNIIITMQCVVAWDFSEGLALIRKYNPDKGIFGHGFIDTTGDFVIPLIWNEARSFSEGMAAVANDKGDFGYIDKSGCLVIPCKYSTAGFFADNLAPIWDNNICQGGYIDKTGSVVITQKDEWDEICEFREGLAPVRHNNGKWGYIDTLGKVVIPFLFEKAGRFGEGYAPIWDSNGNCGYIDKTGEIVIPFNDEWKDASWFEEGLAPVKNIDELWGYIDKTGRLVIPFQWFEADQFEDGEAWVKPSGHYRLINKKGEYVMSYIENKSKNNCQQSQENSEMSVEIKQNEYSNNVTKVFDKIDRFFARIKRMNVIKLFLLTWVIHFSWSFVVGITLFLCGAKFSQHVAGSSEFTNSFLLLPMTALAEEMMFRWGPILILVFVLTYCYRSGRLTKERYFYVEKCCLLSLTLISSIIFGWVHGSVFNVLLQGVSGIIFYIIYLRCFFIERDLGVRDRWQILPLVESSAYHAMANAFLIFI